MLRCLGGEPTWMRFSGRRSKDRRPCSFQGDAARADHGSSAPTDIANEETLLGVVHRDHRRKRIGHALLSHIAAAAPRVGYERLWLETGNKQAPTIVLYEGFGFQRVPPFGAHQNDPTSVRYELRLKPLGLSKAFLNNPQQFLKHF